MEYRDSSGAVTRRVKDEDGRGPLPWGTGPDLRYDRVTEGIEGAGESVLVTQTYYTNHNQVSYRFKDPYGPDRYFDYFVYDDLGRLKYTDNSGLMPTGPFPAVMYYYDLHGNLSRVWTNRHEILNPRDTEYAYDDFGRLIWSSVYSLSASPVDTSYSYDGRGNLVSKTDGRGVTVEYSYDDLDRLVRGIRR